ncbi:MAG: class I SAM-dependent methyltransferase [Candidatus Electryonea clarkiae]|nr:class I SAM-dependent methyltransferase [Candidatus Electryonea clarkiae]MDP8288786.1 class I SAM-dependent methyltransferase [Candidatus Electryonea clarkiae]
MRRNYKGISINTSKNTHETVLNLISKTKDSKIVDIPCGSGAFISRLIDNGYKNVSAVDIENVMEIDHKDFVVGDMNDILPIEDDSIDVLVCIDGIEHINKQFDFVKEVNRILKVDGEFIISTPNISSLRSRWRWFISGHHHKCNSPLDENNPNPLHHIGMISFPEIRYMLHTNGLQIQKVTTNRIKFVSWIYTLFIPLSYLITSSIYNRSGRKEGTSKINKEIKEIMFSKAVLFGETLIVKGIKTTANNT